MPHILDPNLVYYPNVQFFIFAHYRNVSRDNLPPFLSPRCRQLLQIRITDNIDNTECVAVTNSQI